nr:hypothetical protein [Anaerolineaceae bacterium]
CHQMNLRQNTINLLNYVSILWGEVHLVTCDVHTEEKIESAYKRWQSRNNEELGDEYDDE